MFYVRFSPSLRSVDFLLRKRGSAENALDNAAARPSQDLACSGLRPLMGIADHPLHAAQAAAGERAQEVGPVSASEGMTVMPSTRGGRPS